MSKSLLDRDLTGKNTIPLTELPAVAECNVENDFFRNPILVHRGMMNMETA